MREEREQQAPPVQKLRIRYAKRGRARFTSHRDFSRAFERALRRAQVPMAYSSGYSPHPRISYANASPTGAASEAEYLEIGLSEVCDPDRVRQALDAALPPGLDVVAVAPAESGALADLLTGSVWLIALDADADLLARAVQAFLKATEVPVQRLTKQGLRTFDARQAVISLVPVEADATASPPTGRGLRLVLEHRTPLVRPDDVLTGLTNLTPEATPADPPVLTRLTHGRIDREQGTVEDALAPVAPPAKAG